MTPNPKNIGAAPEGFALEVGKTYETRSGHRVLIVSDRGSPPLCYKGAWQGEPPEDGWCDTHDWFSSDGKQSMEGKKIHLDIVRLLPSPDAVGVPEPSPAKGPSLPEVTQPGEGVDLEVTVMFRDNGETAWWSVIEVSAVGQFNDGETFRATLRRESK